MPELLIEIGIEELPSSYMMELNTTLENSFNAFLTEHRWHFEKASLMLTPRRMLFHIQKLSNFQEALQQELKGPPLSVALDKEGNPTQALRGFLSKCKTDSWYQASTEQGDYVMVNLSMESLSVESFFSTYFPKFLQTFPYKKTMRWAKYVFIRPVRWICAFQDQELLPLDLFGLSSEPYTRALHGEEAIRIRSVQNYFETLKQHEIVFCMKERIQLIQKHLPFDADPMLVEENANRSETPLVLRAQFPERFLALPSEVIHTVISSQMKCFPELYPDSSKVSDAFYFVMNGRKNPNLVRKGFEKVVSARLNDAEYFYQQDMKQALSQRIESLKSMVFMEKTGSVYDKIQRIKKTALELNLYSVYPSLEPLLGLFKNDLSTRLIAEFPVLQGTMGKIYASQEGFSEEIASAIEEHYFPKVEGDSLPLAPLGLIVGLLDRADTITGASVHEIPFSSSADPFGLRRCLNGLIRIYTESAPLLSPMDLFSASWKSYEQEGNTFKLNYDQHIQQMGEWFSQRLFLLLSQKHPYDLIQAAQTKALENPSFVVQKIQLLESAKTQMQFRELCEAYSRIKNLLKEKEPETNINASLFEQTEEEQLYESVQLLEHKISHHDAINAELLDLLYTINLPVKHFFEQVFVMSEKSEIRSNRLRLIFEVYRIIHQYFDLSKVVFEGGTAS
jgi:glycyl-tRNA synthetase beta chain